MQPLRVVSNELVPDDCLSLTVAGREAIDLMFFSKASQQLFTFGDAWCYDFTMEQRFGIQVETDEGQLIPFAIIWGIDEAHAFVSECKTHVAKGDALSHGAYDFKAEHVREIRAVEIPVG